MDSEVKSLRILWGPVTQTRMGGKGMILLLLMGTLSFSCFMKNVRIFLCIYLAGVHLRRSNKFGLSAAFGAVRGGKMSISFPKNGIFRIGTADVLDNSHSYTPA